MGASGGYKDSSLLLAEPSEVTLHHCFLFCSIFDTLETWISSSVAVRKLRGRVSDQCLVSSVKVPALVWETRPYQIGTRRFCWSTRGTVMCLYRGLLALLHPPPPPLLAVAGAKWWTAQRHCVSLWHPWSASPPWIHKNEIKSCSVNINLEHSKIYIIIYTGNYFFYPTVDIWLYCPWAASTICWTMYRY